MTTASPSSSSTKSTSYDDGLSVVFLDEVDQFEEPSVTTTAEYR